MCKIKKVVQIIIKIIAFGDGLNDIDMIENCDVGVAMNNALDEVKSKANYITKFDHKYDEIVEFLKEYLDDKCE